MENNKKEKKLLSVAKRKAIGAQIKEQRKINKLTQAKLAEIVGMDEKQLSRIESGKHSPSLFTFLSIIDALGLTLADFEETKECSKTFKYIYYILKETSEKKLKIYLAVIQALQEQGI